MKKTNLTLQTILQTRTCLYTLLAIITLCFVGTYTKIYDNKPDMNGDNIHYYSLGKALAEGKGFTNIMSFKETPHTHFPPGYPVFVAGIMKIFPDSIRAVKIANGILLYGAIVLLFFLLKKLSGNILLSFLTCLFCSLHAEILRYATIMMSEMLFLFCSISTIYLILTIRPERLFTKQGTRDTLLLLLLLFLNNYIYFVRTMGTSLILAVIIYSGILFIKKGVQYYREHKRGQESRIHWHQLLRYGLLFILLASSFAGTKAAWDMRNKSIGKNDNDYISDFLKKPKGQVMTTWNDWKERIQNNLVSYTNKYIPHAILRTSYNLETQSSPEVIRGIGIILLMLFSLIKLRQGGLLLFLYVGATFAVLLVWPEQYGGLRYFIATIPFLIFLFFHGVIETILLVGQRLKKKKYINATIPTVTICILSLLLIFPLYSKALEEKKIMARTKTYTPDVVGSALSEFIAAMQWCGTHLPDSAHMVCRKPELYFLYSGGKKCGGFPQYGKPEDILQQLIHQKTTHVIIDHWFRHAYVTLYPLITTHYPEKFRFIGKFEQRGNKSKEPPTLIYEFHPNGIKTTSNEQ